MDKKGFNDTIIVGFDDKQDDTGVLIVGRRSKTGIDVVNAFRGKEAVELYKRLTEKKASNIE